MQVAPLAIVGPSGIGKGTLIRHLLRLHPTVFARNVSHTTRKPRESEVRGFDYHFVSETEFKELMDRGDMLESAKVHGNFYGTSRAALASIAQGNRIPLLDIDIRGVESIARMIHLNSLFLLPPSWQILEQRLRNRGTESEESLQKRLNRGREEVAQALNHPDQLFTFLVNYDYHLSACSVKYLVYERYNVNLGLPC